MCTEIVEIFQLNKLFYIRGDLDVSLIGKEKNKNMHLSGCVYIIHHIFYDIYCLIYHMMIIITTYHNHHIIYWMSKHFHWMNLYLYKKTGKNISIPLLFWPIVRGADPQSGNASFTQYNHSEVCTLLPKILKK